MDQFGHSTWALGECSTVIAPPPLLRTAGLWCEHRLEKGQGILLTLLTDALSMGTGATITGANGVGSYCIG